MNDRPNDLLRIRPEIKKTKTFQQTSAAENFQNQTIRPILKLQNPLLLAVFENYIHKRKGVFYDLNIEKKMAYIEHAIFKDQKFRNLIKGILIGHFTLDEYTLYCTDSSALNKRMMRMVITRLQDQIQLMEKPSLKIA